MTTASTTTRRGTKVRIGVGLGTATTAVSGPGFGPLVDRLEALRFDSLWLSERISGPAPDPLVALAVAAGRTERLKLGTSVLVVPGRNPVLLAKEMASLDVLSQGRFLPAVGLGAVDPVEQQAFGVRREERGRRLDEALELMRRLWSGEPVDHQGDFYEVQGVRVLPRPHQDTLDVWLGGIAPSELRRVGRIGDGWLPSFCTPEDVIEGIAVIEEAATAAGRTSDPEHYGVLLAYCDGPVPPRIAELVARRRPGLDPRRVVPDFSQLSGLVNDFIAAGATKFVAMPLGDADDWDAELGRLADALLPLET
ncbi:TIGR03619 family F420-dependent LLM class oxidoreductase [Rhabdothermincola salaria]|uniref:TIGR03619 family F420-dependent LLM class oxidoreductase n=1 Tax=Rhabdothermincola salaria TaxID=2903142 RepID=UPI001E51422A|nr:TIGR03619 family F420-dependent LLM class oxidoreductase [Rhabdothermincola salaria]MCD9623463.1 TIGR03619 family F420-dependent LLM class oxidoreductase [Rhabdothermincola salaria]